MARLLLSRGANPSHPTIEGWYMIIVATSECYELRMGRKLCAPVCAKQSARACVA